jgi:putative hemolysin
MAPLVHVAALRVDATVSEARELIKKTGYSRIPIFKNRIDDLFGVALAFDLIGARDPGEAIGRFARRVPFAPETKRADAILVSLQKSRDSMAIVVDEYGGAVGIITIEDILEEVVGEIRDEHDPDPGRVSQLGPGRFAALAGAGIDEVNESTGLRLPREDYETLGGFILKKAGKIPREGETFSLNGAEFSIVKADRRKIREVKIHVKPDESK